MAYVKRGNLEKLNIGSNDSRWDKYIKFANATIDNPSVPIDEKLDVHLRGNSVHIYYKGGRILEIKRNALNLDYNYFYSKKEHQNIPRTWMRYMFDNDQEELRKRNISPEKCLSPSEVKRVWEELQEKRDMLLAMKTPEEYFKEAAKIMDEWSRALLDDSDIKHEERLLQQRISVCNRHMEEIDFIVLDIEFAVTNDKSVSYHSEKYLHPRFDIIALQPRKNFRLAVIELKKGMGATGLKGNGIFSQGVKSGVLDHIAKFEDTIGSARGYREFVQEMDEVLSMKVQCGVLPVELMGIKIPVEKPDFYLAYAGSGMEHFKGACESIGQPCICITDERQPFLKL